MRRALRALSTASVWASFVLSSAPTLAADDAHPPGAASAPAAEASASTKSDTDAKHPPALGPAPTPDAERAAATAYDQALSIYATGDVKGAFDRMRESYRLSQRPELLYNLARLEQELQECQASLEDYRRYLERVPNGGYRADAAQSISELERECPRADPAPPPVPAQLGPTTAPLGTRDQPPPAPTNNQAATYWTPPRVIGWSAIASGVLAEGGMLYFWLAAKDARDDFQKIRDQSQGRGPLDMTAQDRQHRDLAVADVLAVTGGALVTGGVLVLILGPRKPSSDPDSASTSLYLEPGGIGAAYCRSF